MKSFAAILSLTLVAIAGTLQAADAPKQPSPEMKKLEVFVGKWKYEETEVPTPFGPGGKSSYRAVDRLVHDGFFLEERATGQSPGGALSWTWYAWFDVDSGVFRSTAYETGGRIAAGTFTIEANVMTGFGERKVGEKTYKTRTVFRMVPDQKVYTYEASYSEDGNTWKPWYTGKATKVGR